VPASDTKAIVWALSNLFSELAGLLFLIEIVIAHERLLNAEVIQKFYRLTCVLAGNDVRPNAMLRAHVH
jgi:hypothetical protein